jgi:hypothetical protein
LIGVNLTEILRSSISIGLLVFVVSLSLVGSQKLFELLFVLVVLFIELVDLGIKSLDEFSDTRRFLLVLAGSALLEV